MKTCDKALDRVFPLAELPAAHAYMLSNSQCGKIVLSTDDGEA
jgi:NADPH:quinone reductase-like Zn-dependent oxidoreductase